MNKRIVALTLLVLISIAVTVAPVGLVFGQNQNLGVSILQVTPVGAAPIAGQTTTSGSVGDALNLQGTIYASNGQYQVIFASPVVASGTAQGYYVNSNFSIPQVPSGSYALRLKISVQTYNSTENQFQVQTNYTITAGTSKIQEGSSVVLNVAVTGGTVGTSYIADVSVVIPSPLAQNIQKQYLLGTANQQGTATAQITLP